MSGFDDQLEDEDYDLIAENTGLQLQRKKFRRIHGNVLDSDEEEEDGMGSLHPQPPSGKSSGGVSIVREESRDSSMQDEDFAHVRHWSELEELSLWCQYFIRTTAARFFFVLSPKFVFYDVK